MGPDPMSGSLPYQLRLTVIFVLYGGATLAHGSSFLAVFVAAVVIGDARASYK
jgi:potassium/hydrogen antiporter